MVSIYQQIMNRSTTLSLIMDRPILPPPIGGFGLAPEYRGRNLVDAARERPLNSSLSVSEKKVTETHNTLDRLRAVKRQVAEN